MNFLSGFFWGFLSGVIVAAVVIIFVVRELYRYAIGRGLGW